MTEITEALAVESAVRGGTDATGIAYNKTVNLLYLRKVRVHMK